MKRVDRAAMDHIRAPLLVLCLAVGMASTACRVDEQDVRRWETTVNGPKKLQAVLFYEKYDLALRVEAALSLIRMKPRGGVHKGIKILVKTLSEIAPESRSAIVGRLVPSIVTELKAAPPTAQAGQAPPPDASFPYKDAAYAMLTHENTVLINDETLNQSLRETLVDWAMADFEHRLVNRSQSYGMEQLLRYLGAESVKGIPALMTQETRHLDKMSRLVHDHGDDETTEKASAQLVKVAAYVISEDWLKKKKPEVEAANLASKLEPTEKQLTAQLETFQDEELFRVLASMKVVGGRPVTDFALGFAKDDKQGEKRRQAALAALEGRLDRNNAEDLKRIIDIATSGAPDVVLDQAFRRIGEMPRDKVVGRLYKMYETDKWKIRRLAAATVLKMSKVEHIDEFMKKLPGADAKGFAMPEAIMYGAGLGDLKDGKPMEKLTPYLKSGTSAQRATALLFFLTHGEPSDISALERYKSDGQPIPVCDTDEDCAWKCYVPKPGAKDPSTEKELKDVKTVGDLVSLCVIPGIENRAKKKKADEEAAKKGPKKKDVVKKKDDGK